MVNFEHIQYTKALRDKSLTSWMSFGVGNNFSIITFASHDSVRGMHIPWWLLYHRLSPWNPFTFTALWIPSKLKVYKNNEV